MLRRCDTKPRRDTLPERRAGRRRRNATKEEEENVLSDSDDSDADEA